MGTVSTSPLLHATDAVPSSQFYVTFKEAPHLDKKHTVFGKVVGGEDVLDALEKLPRKNGTERPSKNVEITEDIMCGFHFVTDILC
jgi:cyclophilin family peptidyl-prolyl cis-trans isomerase